MDFILALVNNTPYVWWKDLESTTEKDAPFYCKRIPPIEEIKANGCNCAGLINLLHLSRGLSVPGVTEGEYYAGGTYLWFEYLDAKSLLEPVSMDKKYPAGSLLLRKYRSPKDQGHLAVVYTGGVLRDQKLLHCHPDAGITLDDRVMESHMWLPNGYYEYICVDWFQRALTT